MWLFLLEQPSKYSRQAIIAGDLSLNPGKDLQKASLLDGLSCVFFLIMLPLECFLKMEWPSGNFRGSEMKEHIFLFQYRYFILHINFFFMTQEVWSCSLKKDSSDYERFSGASRLRNVSCNTGRLLQYVFSWSWGAFTTWIF